VGRPHKKNGAKKQKIKNGSPIAKVGTRGRGPSPSARDKALVEEVPSPSVGSRLSGKRSASPTATNTALGEIFFVFVFLPQFFCEAFKHYLKLLAQIWLTFDFFVIFR
jgi:hypothetical protein